jgi:hypothetical protein
MERNRVRRGMKLVLDLAPERLGSLGHWEVPDQALDVAGIGSS